MGGSLKVVSLGMDDILAASCVLFGFSFHLPRRAPPQRVQEKRRNKRANSFTHSHINVTHTPWPTTTTIRNNTTLGYCYSVNTRVKSLRAPHDSNGRRITVFSRRSRTCFPIFSSISRSHKRLCCLPRLIRGSSSRSSSPGLIVRLTHCRMNRMSG